MKQKSFKLFSNCIPVRGYAESLILDLQYKEYYSIPNLLFEVLKINENKDISETKLYYQGQFNKGIEKYFQQLANLGVGFFLEDPSQFPEMSVDWYSPYPIQSSIIEFDFQAPKFCLKNAIEQIIELGSPLLHFQIIGEVNIENLLKIHDLIKNSRVLNLELTINYKSYSDELKSIFNYENSRLTYIYVHSCSAKNKIGFQKIDTHRGIKFLNKKISSLTTDTINLSNFIINVDFFFESQQFNTALNRKVCIDTNGNIKNHLSHTQQFGNIDNKQLNKIIKSKAFQKKWSINNNRIEKCKDCQFRYMCHNGDDLVVKGGKNFKVLDCGFNPYLNKWIKNKS